MVRYNSSVSLAFDVGERVGLSTRELCDECSALFVLSIIVETPFLIEGVQTNFLYLRVNILGLSQPDSNHS